MVVGTGIGAGKLETSILQAIKLGIPEKKEQTKIANFLATVDEKITQLTRKCELLALYKKGVMHHLFSQELRFKDEVNQDFPEWEEKKLKDIFIIRYGKNYKHLDSGNIPVIGTGGIMTYVDEFLYDKPSVLIGRKGTIDKPQFIEKPFWTVDTLFYTEINKGFVPFFAYLLVLQINWYKFNEATGVPSLNTTAINNIDVFVPSSFQEQTKIANFLTAIDEKITQTQTYLETVKKYKQGLLQQMFI
jgi:type I restriction enzyme S subunit